MKRPEKNIWETPPPWNREQIHYSVFASPSKSQETVNQLPGAKVYNDTQSLHFSLNIFLDATDDLISSVNIFKGEVEKPNFWDRPQKQHFEKLERNINRGVFSSTAAAMALVDNSREFSKKYSVESYQEKIDQLFTNNPQHKFIHSLRNYFSHVKITKANWKIEVSKGGRSVFFLLDQAELLKWNNWKSLAKQFINEHPNDVNVESLFAEYSKSVKGFHDWLRSAVWEVHSQDISEFLSYLRAVKGVSSYSAWNLLIQQAYIPKEINPYMFLDRYLTSSEIDEVLAMKHRSKEQIDRIIEIIDEYQICDEKLRNNIYKLFKINTI